MSYESDLIKSRLNPVDVARKFGLQVNRKDRAKCPFHNGTDFNFKLNNQNGGKCYCFVCHKSCDSIGLAMKLLDMNFLDAIKTLDSEFGLNVLGDKHQAFTVARHKASAFKSKFKSTQVKSDYSSLCKKHQAYHMKLKERPSSWEDMDDLFVEALQKQDDLEWKLYMMDGGLA